MGRHAGYFRSGTPHSLEAIEPPQFCQTAHSRLTHFAILRHLCLEIASSQTESICGKLE